MPTVRSPVVPIETPPAPRDPVVPSQVIGDGARRALFVTFVRFGGSGSLGSAVPRLWGGDPFRVTSPGVGDSPGKDSPNDSMEPKN